MRVKKGPAATEWDERDSVLLQVVDELLQNRGISAPTQDRASQHFTANQIMDVIAIHGLYVTLACLINTWELELDTHVRERLPDSVTRDIFMSGP